MEKANTPQQVLEFSALDVAVCMRAACAAGTVLSNGLMPSNVAWERCS